MKKHDLPDQARPPHHRQGRPALVILLILWLIGGGACECEPTAPMVRVGEPLTVSPSRPEPPAPRSGAALVAPADAEPGLGAFSDAEATATGDGAVESSSAGLRRAWTLTHQADRAAQQGNLQQAVKLCEKAVRTAPERPWPRVAWAWYLSRTGQLAPAREQLEGIVEQGPTHAVLKAAAYHGLGELQESRRDWARARESYRTALRTLPAPALARALLRLTPPDSDQRQAAEHMAYGPTLPPQRLLAAYTARLNPGQREPVAALPTEGGTVVLVGQGEPRSELLPTGSAFEVQDTPPESSPSSPPPWRVPLGRTAGVRWTRGQVKQVRLSPSAQGLWLTLQHTRPGAGAPTDTYVALVQRGALPERAVLFNRQTAHDTETEPGCREGWRETLTLLDRDHDGITDYVEIAKQTYSQPQATEEEAAPRCAEQTRVEATTGVPVEVVNSLENSAAAPSPGRSRDDAGPAEEDQTTR